jgi:Holliday junction resolvase RusA-like endonuclease
MVSLVITGQPFVKKSNQKVVWKPRLKRSIKYDTQSYKNWHISALEQLAMLGYNPEFKKQNKQLKELKQPTEPALIDFPVNLQCRFFMKDNGRCDLSALYEGIQDVLVEVGILEDDRWSIVASHDGSGVSVDAKNPRMEITITPKNEATE